MDKPAHCQSEPSTSWFDTDLGQKLLQLEIDSFPALVPPKYYPQGVCLQNTNIDTCQQLNVGCLARVSTDLEPNADIVATPESLPFGESTIDLILLPHTL
ncbi:MAG: hypothetical protein ACI9PZ_000156, partial [Parvicella sp.]